MKVKHLIPALMLLGVLLGGTPAQGVSPYDDSLVQKAAKDIEQENYDEALAGLTEAWTKGTKTPEKAFLLGQTYRLMLNYPKAREYLQEALKLKANFPQAQLMLADTLIALDKPQEAVPLLEALEATGYDPGQVAFFRGMVEAKQGRHSQALDYFRKAEADPRVAQEAKFQASLALAALNRLKEARESMKQAAALDTQTPTADFAQRYMGILERRYEEVKPFRASLAAGFDFDSNVTLAPAGGAAVQVAGKGDAVFTQIGTLEYNLGAGKPFSLLTQYSYFQNFHPRVSGFDLMSHYTSLIPTFSYSSGRVWLPVSYSYVDVSSDKYYTGVLVTPTWLQMLNERVGVEVGTRFNRKYYWLPISFPQDDRSGKNLGANVGAYYFFKKQAGFLQARFSFEHDFTTGNNWDNSSYRLLLSALYPATDKLKFNVFLDLTYQPFDHRFFNGAGFETNREDKILVAGLQISYEFYKNLDFNIHYFFTRDESNTAIYNYSRHIVGCQVGYRF